MNKIVCALLAFVGWVGAVASECTLAPGRLRVEHLENPPLVDVDIPRFSWVDNPSDPLAKGLSQSGYRIVVSSSAERLASGDYDVWDSGKVKSARSYLVGYGGSPLSPGGKFHWKVMVWDGADVPSAWSEVATFGTGLSDFKAKWIGGDLLKRDFKVKGKVKSARAYVSAMGWFELFVNGQKVSGDKFVPNFTCYTSRTNLADYPIVIQDYVTAHSILYLAYDVDSLLHKGKNTVSVMVGRGWAETESILAASFGKPRFMCQLEIEYADGTTETVVSDENWQSGRSPIVMNGLYDGEVYDANVKPGKWEHAAVLPAPDGILTPQCAPADRVLRRYSPVAVRNVGEKEWEVEFPVEIAGWLRLHDLLAAKGDTVSVTYISESPQGISRYVSDGKRFGYAPRFSWFVFSKARVSGVEHLAAVNVVAEAVGTDVPVVTEFSSSNKNLERILGIWKQSEIDNLHSGVPSDCPHRERAPYTGDGQVTMQAVLDHFDAASFYRKWLRDIRDAQNPSTGYVPNGAPWEPTCGGGPAWGAAMSLMPWEYYVHYGDSVELAANYPAMKKQLEYMKGWLTPDGTMLMNRGNDNTPQQPMYWLNLGEWCAPFGLPSQELVHTFYLWLCADHTAKAAAALGHDDDARSLAAFRDRVAAAFHKKFYDDAAGSYGDFGSNVFALKMGVPTELRHRVVESLRRGLVEKHGGHLDTGIFGTRFLFEVLAENGLNDLAYAVITACGFPGYMDWLDRGATVTWENWNGEASRNHPMFGGGLTWLRSGLAGLQSDPSQPGFRRFAVAPRVPSEVDSVCFATMTPQGVVSVDYKRGRGMDVVVPVGSEAVVVYPWDKTRKQHTVGQGYHVFPEPMAIAHRGHWRPQGSSENSIRALVKADSIGCHGSEFDVWITSDDVVVVNHNTTAGDVVIEHSPAPEVCAQRIGNGDHVSTLDAYLDTALSLSTRLVCEIKPHGDKRRERKLIEMVLDEVAARGLEKRTDYITFSREALSDLIKLVPAGTEVYYLSGDLTPEELAGMGAAGPDYHISVYRAHPDWVERSHRLGLKVNVWTVDSDEDLQWCIDNGVDFVTINRPDRLHEMLAL